MQAKRFTTTSADLARRACVELELRCRAPRGDRGQGTVEYVALILLVGAIMTAVVAAGGKSFNIGDTIGDKLKTMIETVGGGDAKK
ncbi:hypothetical protein DSM112329_03495 [Paraconexibacter sp. AEG42_29]|uniref:Flp family type IVb pilin n=1 Tax=Paraconexibacter sp. AEG42_29 TaxID=2997339 RepID=A0AAU7AYY7_9ACTN